MDFFRRLLGLGPSTSYSYRHDDKLFNDMYPTEELPGHNGFNNSEQEDPFHSHQIIDSIGQIEQMFQMMDQVMRGSVIINPGMNGFGGQFGGQQGSILDSEQGSEQLPDPSAASPRDQMLKQPDSALPSGAKDGDGNHFQHQQQILPFDHQRGPGMFSDPFSMLEHFAQSFGKMDSFAWSHNFGSAEGRELPGSSSQSPRDTLLKEDVDLDEQAKSSDIRKLLDEGPGYTNGPQASDGSMGPAQSVEPYSRSSFTSTSIRRIVKPDGSIEERRTYRDSSGKEEVTVTEMEPGSAGSLFPSNDPFNFGGGRRGPSLGDIFGGFLR